MSTKTILLIEDNPDDRELMRLAFSETEIEHDLVMVEDGLDAIDYLLGQGKYSDRNSNVVLILLDLNLPKLNGIEVLQRIRSHPRTRLLPTIVMSSSTEPQDILQSYQSGCNSYIRKPLDFTQLQNFVREITVYWLKINQLPPISGVPHE